MAPKVIATTLFLRSVARLAAILGWICLGCAPVFADGAGDYKLSPGDIITFDFLDDAELPLSLTITGDGQAQFPIIGGVRVAGLTVPEALDALRGEYKTRQILVEPKIALNVSTVRPIFVLGEVKSPGSFPFYTGLTVEQAVGLAGGTQSAVTNPSDRIIARARLRGEIEGATAEIVHEALYAARLVSQLKGQDKIDLGNLPEKAQPYMQNISMETAIEVEEQILKTDLATSKAQADILTQGIAETEQGLKILGELIEQQKQVLKSLSEDVVRASSLRERGLNTAADLSRTQRTESEEKARLLEIYSETSRSRRELGSLRLELAKLRADRENDILTKLQEREIAIEKLIATRNSSEEQFFLMASVAADEQKKQQTISFAYEVRRNTGSGTESIAATRFTEVVPGDVIVVSIAGM